MKKAKLFQNGQSQAVRLPKEFRFGTHDKEVYIKKSGKMIVLLPTDENPWNALINSLGRFSEDFMEDREQLVQQDRDDIFS